MYIKKVRMQNFRNYEDVSLTFSPGINLIYGENGSGKTNIIEAIYWISIGKSFRSSEDTILVKHGKPGASVWMDAVYNADMEKAYAIEYDRLSRKKIIRVNDNRLKRNHEIIGQVPLVVFSPEDIMIVKGEPSLRRRFIDDLIIQIQPGYFELYTKYQKEVSHRNYLLKQIREGKAEKSSLTVWNELIKRKGIEIIVSRIDILKEINKILNDQLKSVRFKIEVQYNSKAYNNFEESGLVDSFEKHFRENIDEEIARNMTLIGPQRDDLDIFYDGLSAKQFSSEGQQRTVTILLKLAEARHLKKSLGMDPVILLDDFSSELDDTNKEFISRTFEHFRQIIITTTYKQNIRGIKPSKEFKIENLIISETK